MSDFKHGLTGWVKHKCKCDVCREAKAEAQARYRKNMKPGTRKKQNAANARWRAKRETVVKVDPGIRSEANLLPDDWTW